MIKEESVRWIEEWRKFGETILEVPKKACDTSEPGNKGRRKGINGSPMK